MTKPIEMGISYYEGKKYQIAQTKLVEDALTVEEALQIVINNKPFTITMRTPGDDEALIRGLLYSEDVYRQTAPLVVDFRQKNKITTIAQVQLARQQLGTGIESTRNLLAVSSCGICGRQALDANSTFKSVLTKKAVLNPAQLYQAFEQMREQQVVFLRSGGAHAAAAISAQGEILVLMEDIGRHNAVDKVIGALLQQEQLEQAVAILVSGRISYEIVSKVYSAHIPILAAVSAPSSLAVEYAKQFGLTLLGFCRGQRATCYANTWRIAEETILD
ncbi:MAG: formate dehydrogenase accessory sulfurtransferase FdhD [Aureispira sp.]